MAEFLMRDAFNMRIVKKLAKCISKNHSAFKEAQFVKHIEADLENRGLNERSELIHEALVKFLPQDYKKSRKILLVSIPVSQAPEGETSWDGFIMLPMCHYIATQGIDYFEESMDALKQMTEFFSSEMAVRFFIKKYPKKSMKLMLSWTKDKNAHIRRLASEGCRPRLPWAMGLPDFKKDPSLIIPILDALKEDPELYVRRSVANNLNDIAKDNPKVVTDLLKTWKLSKNKGTQWLIKHALRTLLKQGNTDALALLGYDNPDVNVSPLNLNTKKLQFESDLEFSFTITSNKKQNLMVDYVIHYMKANGKLAPKVYKLTKKSVAQNETLEITKKQQFKTITTRVFHPGLHAIEIQINGKKFSYVEFELLM